ncbi:MAG: LysR family transcriptional regulator, partial [Pseudomonadota bacterium]
MSLNNAAIFVAVVQAGSFTAAASQLRLPKTTVSRAVANLERDLGTQLLHRSTRSMTLTGLGERYYDGIVVAVQAIQDVSKSLASSAEDTPMTLRLITSPDVGTELLPDILAEFRSSHPKVSVDVSLTLIAPSPTGQKFDLALWGGALADSNFICTTLQDSEFGLYASPTYIERRGLPDQPVDLTDHECILMRPDRASPKWTLIGPKGKKTLSPKPTLSTNDVAFLRNTVLAGCGIGPMPQIMASRWTKLGSLVRVLPDYTMAGYPLYLLQPSKNFPVSATEALKTAIVSKLRAV